MITATSFGSVTVDWKKYEHDIWIFSDGKVKERNKSHLFTKEEFDLLAKDNPEVIVVGRGHDSVMRISDEAKKAAKEKGIELITASTPEAMNSYNGVYKKKKTAASIHTTC